MPGHFWDPGIKIQKLPEVSKTGHFSIIKAKFKFSDKN